MIDWKFFFYLMAVVLGASLVGEFLRRDLWVQVVVAGIGVLAIFIQMSRYVFSENKYGKRDK